MKKLTVSMTLITALVFSNACTKTAPQRPPYLIEKGAVIKIQKDAFFYPKKNMSTQTLNVLWRDQDADLHISNQQIKGGFMGWSDNSASEWYALLEVYAPISAQVCIARELQRPWVCTRREIQNFSNGTNSSYIMVSAADIVP